MILKNVLLHIFERKSVATVGLAMARRARSNGFDVKSLEPTMPLTDAERAERYRTGRFAEMTDSQAGL
jgi:hypothetical protein